MDGSPKDVQSKLGRLSANRFIGRRPADRAYEVGEILEGTVRSKAEIRTAVRSVAPAVEEFLISCLERPDVDIGEVSPEAIAQLILTEFVDVLTSKVIDPVAIQAIVGVHQRLGIGVRDIVALYSILIQTLGGTLGPEVAALLAQHECEVLAETVRVGESRASSREDLHRTLVEVVNLVERFTILDEDTVFSQLTSLIADAAGAPLVYLAEAVGSPEIGFSGSVTIRAVAGSERSYVDDIVLSTDETHPNGRGPVGIALRTGRITVATSRDFPNLDPWRERLELHRLGSAIAVPFPISLKRSGAFVVYRSEDAPFPEDIEDILAGIGAELSRLFALRARHLRDLRLQGIASVRTSLAVSDASDLEAIFDQVACDVVASDVVKFAAVFVPIAHRESLTSTTVVGLPAGLEAEIRQITVVLEDTQTEVCHIAVARSYLRQEVVTMPGLPAVIAARVDLSHTCALLEHDYAVIGIPFVADGESHGVLMVVINDDYQRALDRDVVNGLNLLVEAGVARVAYNRAQTEASWLAAIYRTLLDSASVMVSADSVDELLRSFCDALVSGGFFSAAWVAVPDYMRNRLCPVAAAGSGAQLLQNLKLPLDHLGAEPLPLRAWRTGETLVNDDQLLDGELGPWKDFLIENDWHSVASVPLRRGGAIMGALTVVSGKRAAFGSSVVGMVETVARMIEHGLAEIDLKASLEEEQRRQGRAARTDFLTGLANRFAFEQGVNARLLRRRDGIVAVGILDLDGFKELNDTLGHRAGDVFLKLLGKNLVESMEPGELVARLGGDEFGFCSELERVSDLSRFVERIMAVIDSMRGEIMVSASLGWSIAPVDGNTYETLLARADEALYAAKAAGRHRSYLFGGSIARASELRREVRSLLPKALSEGLLGFAYQPKFDARTGTMVGVEMLLRWPRLPLASVIGEIHQDGVLARALGRFVIASALKARRELDALGYHELDISINIAPSHFQSEHFLADTEPLWDSSRGRFIVEITEDAALDDLEVATQAIEGLHSHGVLVSLDDFGTGYASLSNIATLAVDEIKVDRTFISRFEGDSNAFAVVSSLVLLAELAGAVVIAEGVETDEQLGLWLRLGGNRVQGYFYSRPVPFEELLVKLQGEGPAPRGDVAFPAGDLALVAHLAAMTSDSVGSCVFSVGATVIRHCGLGRWFRRRRSRWGVCDNFDEAEQLHALLHGDDLLIGQPRLVAPWIEERFHVVLAALSQEIEATLQSRAASAKPSADTGV
ncbi:MAG: bifunctional diguanylate cyclase/phosphodiesterase [Ferrimicrobium sp.]